MKYDFEHYLQAGHGRAYMIAKADPERYREKIMDACRKDYAYDMQSEGSLLTWAYESTLCSWCRKNIVEKMINRGMLTDELKEELRWDANLDISKMVDDDREEE